MNLALSFCDQKTVESRESALVACLVTSSWGVQSTGDSFWSFRSALVAHSAEEMQKIVDPFSNASKKFGLKKTEVLYQPNSTRTIEEDIMVDGNKMNSVLEFTYLEALYQVTDALTMKHRGGWPKLVQLSANYARDSGTTTMCPCGLKARYTVQSYCPPSNTEPRHGQCTCTFNGIG